MNSSKLATLLKLLFLISLTTALSACQTIVLDNAHTCSVAGIVTAGLICSNTNSAATNDLSFNELSDMLVAQPQRTCVPVGHWMLDPKTNKPTTTWVMDFNICADDQSVGVAQVLPPRAAAIIVPASEWADRNAALEEGCRKLKNNCIHGPGPAAMPSPSATSISIP